MRVLTSATIVAPLILVLAACGGASTPAASSARASATPAPTSPSASVVDPSDDVSPDPSLGTIPSQAISGAGDLGGSFTLLVEGGSLAGTYTSNNASGACLVQAGNLSMSLEGIGAGPSGKSVFVTVSGVLAQATAGTSEFQMALAFGVGEAVAGYPAPSGTNGNLKVNDRGSSLTFVASGDVYVVAGGAGGTSETVKVDLRAECTRILRQ